MNAIGVCLRGDLVSLRYALIAAFFLIFAKNASNALVNEKSMELKIKKFF